MSKLTEQIDAAAELSWKAFAAGDFVTGVAAIKLAAQLVKIMRLRNVLSIPPETRSCDETDVK